MKKARFVVLFVFFNIPLPVRNHWEIAILSLNLLCLSLYLEIIEKCDGALHRLF